MLTYASTARRFKMDCIHVSLGGVPAGVTQEASQLLCAACKDCPEPALSVGVVQVRGWAQRGIQGAVVDDYFIKLCTRHTRALTCGCCSVILVVV